MPADAGIVAAAEADHPSQMPEPAGWNLATAESRIPAPPEPAYGPPPPESGQSAPEDERFASFGSQVGTVKWEVAGVAAYVTAVNVFKIVDEGSRSFRFQDEGWFGKSTANLGVDKLAHAFNAYLIAEILHARIRRKSDGASGGALTAAILASGLSAYSELYDAHKKNSGFSYQDVVFNLAGAGFSALRNTIPGMKEKVDFRLLLMPNSDIYTFKGKRHFAQQRFLLALQLSGFEGFEDSPLRFIELHAGYYAKGFTARDRERGEVPRRKPFFGIGLNLQELLFRSPRSTAGRVGRTALDYLQTPYTAIHLD